ncbi:MAG TPA: rRNA maturation RNase YbeY [Caulobacteraceae bacterium]
MIQVQIEDPRWRHIAPNPAGAARDAAALAIGAAGVPVDMACVLLLTDDKTVRDLSRRFRGRDLATNVLAFPAPVGAAGVLGDIALAFGVCEREARDQGKGLIDHLRHLVIHGVLHLVGHDHQTPDEAARMEAIEIELLGRLGVPDPYFDRSGEEHLAQSR